MTSRPLTGTRIPLPSQGHHTDTGLASQSGRLFGPPPANRQVSRQCPRRGSFSVRRVPRGAPCSLGLWPEDLCKGLLSGGSTAARALPRDLEVLSPAGLAAEEVTGGALEEDHILCPAACTRHSRPLQLRLPTGKTEGQTRSPCVLSRPLHKEGRDLALGLPGAWTGSLADRVRRHGRAPLLGSWSLGAWAT